MPAMWEYPEFKGILFKMFINLPVQFSSSFKFYSHYTLIIVANAQGLLFNVAYSHDITSRTSNSCYVFDVASDSKVALCSQS